MSYDNDNSDANDVRDESMSQTTRRGLLGALGVAGLASLGSSSASANLSGGPEADAMAEYRVPTYRVPESELDTPGVVGREVTITSGGATYDTGDQLVDLGDRWELVSPNYGSLSTAQLNTDIRQKESESVQDAIDRASQGEKVALRSGTFNENVTVTTTNLSVVGTGRGTLIDGGTNDAILVEATAGVTIRDLAVQTTNNGNGNNDAILITQDGSDACVVTNVWIEESDAEGVRLTPNGTDARIFSVWGDAANINFNTVKLQGSGSIADNIIGSVDDAGTGNTIGDVA